MCKCCGESLWKRLLCPECDAWAYELICKKLVLKAYSAASDIYEEFAEEAL